LIDPEPQPEIMRVYYYYWRKVCFLVLFRLVSQILIYEYCGLRRTQAQKPVFDHHAWVAGTIVVVTTYI